MAVCGSRTHYSLYQSDLRLAGDRRIDVYLEQIYLHKWDKCHVALYGAKARECVRHTFLKMGEMF